MSSTLAQLSSLARLLEHDAQTLELSVRAMHEVCPRGLAFGLTTRGPHADAIGVVRLMHGGQMITPAMSHLAHVRTPAYDVAAVPGPQRNRWFEPFREGIATHAGFKASTLYPMVERFGVLEMGRVAVCAGARQVALVGVAVPEGTTFSDGERQQLQDTGAALVVPLRVAAVLADQLRERSALDRLLQSATDALIATDARGTVLATSRSAAMLLRHERVLTEHIERAVRGAAGRCTRTEVGAHTIHVSSYADDDETCLVAIDSDGYVEPPVRLTPRQTELLALVEKGLSNAEMAAAMSLAPATIKTMLERLYQRVGVAGRGELASWARRRLV